MATNYPVTMSEGVDTSDGFTPKQILSITAHGGVNISPATERFSVTSVAPKTLSFGIGIHGTLAIQLQRAAIIRETIGLHQTTLTTARYHYLLRDYIAIHDALKPSLPVTLHGAIGLHDAWRAVTGLLVIEGLRLRSTLAGQAKHYQVMAEGVRLNSALRRFVGASLHQGIGIHDTLSRRYVSRPVMTEGVTIASVLGRSLLFSYTMREGVKLSPHQVLKSIYRQTYHEGVKIGLAYVSPDGSVTTWAVNTRTGATTEYENYEFTSFTKIGDKYLAASPKGLYELDGDDDNGTDIISDIAGGFVQFGDSHLASLKAVYLGLRGGGDFVFRLVEGDGTTRDYAVSAKDMRTTRVKLGKGLRARYFAYELISTGQDFDLDNIEFVPIVLQRRV